MCTHFRSLIAAALVASAAAGMGAELHGSGTTNPSRLFWQASSLIEARAKMALRITYRAVGSSVGQREFVGEEPYDKSVNDFGAGDIPMKPDNYDKVVGSGREMLHVPFVMGGIGVFHNVPQSELVDAEGKDRDLNLTACVLAKIFSRQITRWDAQEIKDINPGFSYGGEIKVVHRKKGSSSTAGFTEYLEGSCPEVWNAPNECGPDGCGSGSTIPWPEKTATEQGSGRMAKYISDNEGGIGYVDAGHGYEARLNEIALQNKHGIYLTTRQADIGAAATYAINADPPVIPAEATDSFASVNLYDMEGEDTWPITMISYFYLNKNISHMAPLDAALLVYFVEYILSPEGQELAKEHMFVPCPESLLMKNAVTLSTLILPEGYEAFKTELGGQTIEIQGQGEYYISGKRSAYHTVVQDSLEDGLEDLDQEVDELDEDLDDAVDIWEDGAMVPYINDKATPPPAPPAAPPSANTEDVDQALLLGKVGVGLGATGLALGLIALIVAVFKKPSREAAPRSQEISVRELEKPSEAPTSCTATEKV